MDNYDQIYSKISSGELDVGLGNNINKKIIYNYNNLVETSIVILPVEILIASKEGLNKENLIFFDKGLIEMKANEESYFYQRYNYWIGVKNGTLVSRYIMKIKQKFYWFF